MSEEIKEKAAAIPEEKKVTVYYAAGQGLETPRGSVSEFWMWADYRGHGIDKNMRRIDVTGQSSIGS